MNRNHVHFNTEETWRCKYSNRDYCKCSLAHCSSNSTFPSNPLQALKFGQVITYKIL